MSSAPLNQVSASSGSSTAKLQIYNPENAPTPEMDCFGKFYLAGNVACDGDSNVAGDTPCFCRSECQLRSQRRNEAIRTALSSNKEAAPRKKGLLCEVEQMVSDISSFGVEGIEVKDEVISNWGKQWRVAAVHKGGRRIFYVIPGNKDFYFEGFAQFSGGSKNGNVFFCRPRDWDKEYVKKIVQELASVKV